MASLRYGLLLDISATKCIFCDAISEAAELPLGLSTAAVTVIETGKVL